MDSTPLYQISGFIMMYDVSQLIRYHDLSLFIRNHNLLDKIIGHNLSQFIRHHNFIPIHQMSQSIRYRDYHDCLLARPLAIGKHS